LQRSTAQLARLERLTAQLEQLQIFLPPLLVTLQSAKEQQPLQQAEQLLELMEA
jgi:hypothetical protein